MTLTHFDRSDTELVAWKDLSSPRARNGEDGVFANFPFANGAVKMGVDFELLGTNRHFAWYISLMNLFKKKVPGSISTARSTATESYVLVYKSPIHTKSSTSPLIDSELFVTELRWLFFSGILRSFHVFFMKYLFTISEYTSVSRRQYAWWFTSWLILGHAFTL